MSLEDAASLAIAAINLKAEKKAESITSRWQRFHLNQKSLKKSLRLIWKNILKTQPNLFHNKFQI